MMNYYSSYNNGLKVGDLIRYEVKKKLYLSHTLKGEYGIVLDKVYIFKNKTKWGSRKFFLYSIMNFNGRIYKLKTQNIKILSRTGAL